MKRNKPRPERIAELLLKEEEYLYQLLSGINIKTRQHIQEYLKRRQKTGSFRNFHPYKHLRSTYLWRDAREIHIALNIKKYGMQTCEKCEKEIHEGFGILHHIEYQESLYFTFCCIMHSECHEQYHFPQKFLKI